jgi:hypothetical protein
MVLQRESGEKRKGVAEREGGRWDCHTGQRWVGTEADAESAERNGLGSRAAERMDERGQRAARRTPSPPSFWKECENKGVKGGGSAKNVKTKRIVSSEEEASGW